MDNSTPASTKLDYCEWNAEVARILRDTSPGLRVEYFTQLGGGIQAVGIGVSDGLCVVISDDAICSYLCSAEDWEGYEDYETMALHSRAGYTEPLVACCMGVALLKRQLCVYKNTETIEGILADLAAKDHFEYRDYELELLRYFYPLLFAWVGVHHQYTAFLRSNLHAALTERAPLLATMRDAASVAHAWYTVEDVEDMNTALHLLESLLAHLR